jgi:hypothetical protein
MRHLLALAVMLLTVAPMARAAGDDEAASVPVDQTTPRGTLKVFALAVQEAQGEKVRQCLHTTKETEARYAQRYAEVSVAMGRFRSAMLEHFGEKAAMTLRALAPIREGHHIDAAVEQIKGTEALVEIKGDRPETIALVQVEGKWKIAISKMIAGRSASEARSDLEAMSALADAYIETAKQVRDGRHKSAPAAVNALRKNVEKRLPQAKPKEKPRVATKNREHKPWDD